MSSTANAIRLYAGSHPTLTESDVASYFDSKLVVVATALARGEAARIRAEAEDRRAAPS